jgi:hypothetical protein
MPSLCTLPSGRGKKKFPTHINQQVNFLLYVLAEEKKTAPNVRPFLPKIFCSSFDAGTNKPKIFSILTENVRSKAGVSIFFLQQITAVPEVA